MREFMPNKVSPLHPSSPLTAPLSRVCVEMGGGGGAGEEERRERRRRREKEAVNLNFPPFRSEGGKSPPFPPSLFFFWRLQNPLSPPTLFPGLLSGGGGGGKYALPPSLVVVGPPCRRRPQTLITLRRWWSTGANALRQLPEHTYVHTYRHI